METENNRYIVQVFVGALSPHYEALSVEASKQTTSEEIVQCIVERLSLSTNCNFELAEVVGDTLGRECKERRLGPLESPVALMLLWPRTNQQEYYRFYLREKLNETLWTDGFTMDPQLIKDYFCRFLYQPADRDYPDLCQLPDLNEQTLLDNLRARFNDGHIYTYVGSILIALNPFKFHPIYNPKYVKLYQNRRMGPELPPHIFAVADSAYHCMLRNKRNQCIVISGESGSGKTESTNFLLHHLTALSQKGSHGSGVEQTILSAGPVLEAFGNAKTAHNNNSSRFGKFIQVNYKENGMVHGAVVQKYLLEKSRICSQGRNERNYHVFYYLLQGATEADRQLLHLRNVEYYNYLNKSGCTALDNVDEKYEFSRLKQSMEMVGFTPEKQRRLFAVLSAVLLLGNVEFQPRKAAYHHDEAVGVKNPEVVKLISELLRVKEETLLAALTAKRARASGETLVINYRLPEATAARDAMAKCLYGALFDWIVLQVNHALLSKKDTLRDHQGNSIGVLDIFGFEDFGLSNSFEQFCINYANEHLQHYFNQHVFKYEQEEYRKEGIRWRDIAFLDNSPCLHLIEGKPNGLLCLLDDQCNFPGASNETLLQKFNSVHKDNPFYEMPQKREAAFMVRHYAGKVKYQVHEMREKNLDLMRQEIVGVLKNSNMAFVRELVGADPVAVFRWAIVRAFFRGYFAFHEAGRKHRLTRDGSKPSSIHARYRNHTPNDTILRFNSRYTTQQHTAATTTTTAPSRIYTTKSEKEQLNNIKQQNNDTTKNTVTNIETSNQTTKRSPLQTTCYLSDKQTIHKLLYPEVFEKATQIVAKNRSFRPRERGKKGLKNLQSVKTLAGRTQSLGQLGKARKQPLTVTAQFQQSLHSLMDTLNQANPFFIRCIKSNSNKIPHSFDDETVQRQLRYTGMLETVRIRQAGYNVRLTYDEFIQLYRILLPKGLQSSEGDVKDFLLTLNLNRDNYQLGSSKIFMRECEKVKLDYRLHQQIIASIVKIQRWFRTILERARFLRLRAAVIAIQAWWRMVSCQQLRRTQLTSVVQIQRAWRSYSAGVWLRKLRSGLVPFQAQARGYLVRKRLEAMKPKPAKVEEKSSPSVESLPERSRSNSISEEKLRGSYSSGGGRKELSEEMSPSDSSGFNVSPEKSPTKEFSSSSNFLSRGRKLPKSHPQISPREKFLLGNRNHSEDIVGYDDFTLERGRDCPGGKGSFDSFLTPQRSLDSLNTALVKEKLIKAKRHFRAFIGKDRGERRQTGAGGEEEPAHHSDSEMDRGPGDWTTGELMKKSKQPVEEDGGGGPAPPLQASAPPPRQPPPRRRDILCRSIGEDSAPTTAPPLLKPTKLPLSSVDMKRRNSDPAGGGGGGGQETGAGGGGGQQQSAASTTGSGSGGGQHVAQPPNHSPSADLLEWKGTTMFTIAGHSFRKVSRFTKEDRCAYCSTPMDAFFTQGHKCAECKQLFHTKCIQNGGVHQLPCRPGGRDGGGRRGKRKSSSRGSGGGSSSTEKGGGVHLTSGGGGGLVTGHAKFNLTGTSEFTDSTDKIISDINELQSMQDFITKKIYKIEAEEGEKPSKADKVFKQALKEFKDNLIATYSVFNKQGPETLNIKYKDLIANFSHVMETVRLQEEMREDFPVTMGVNAFRGFMNEFMSSRSEPEKPRKTKRKKEKKRKVEDPILHKGHHFLLTIINIATACEICNTFIMWPIERGLVCQNCKFTSHKKCYTKVVSGCSKEVLVRKQCPHPLFGVPLQHLTSAEEKIPLVVDRLITTIEMYGLYTEGIYRKSGVSSKVKELKVKMEEGRNDSIQFEHYQVHVLCSVLKSFLREMPEPLLTFDCYDDFLRAASLTEDRVSTMFAILKKLPQPNFDLMERLIFHLARVALHEDVNRMSASSLAIVFAPCILRTNKVVPAQDSLHDISRQTSCIEVIVSEQLRKVRSTLADIDTLDTACHTATYRLSSIRSSKIFSQEELVVVKGGGGGGGPASEDEEAELMGKIEEIQKEKALLTSTLPSLTRSPSDDDLLSTDDGSLDDVDTSNPQPLSRHRVVHKHKKRGSESSSTTFYSQDCDEDPIMV